MHNGLLLSELHSSINDASLQGVEFLNEAARRYPDAISFAPGAPFPPLYDDIDLIGAIREYESYVRAAARSAKGSSDATLYEYSSAKGTIGEVLARWLLKDHDIEIDPKAVVITVGCQEAILLTLRALVRDSSDAIAAVTPCYLGCIGASRFLGINLLPVRETSDGVDLDDLEEVVKAALEGGTKVRALFIAPDFSNPSGTQMSLRRRHALLQLARRMEILLIEDGTYSFATSDSLRLPSLKALDDGRYVVHLGTFSKICFPGARVGYILGDVPVRSPGCETRTLADSLARLKTTVSVNTSPVCQAVIAGMILRNNYTLTAFVESRSRHYLAQLEHLLLLLDEYLGGQSGISWTRPRGGFFVIVQLPVVVDNALLKLSAEQFRVLWTPMCNFYLDCHAHYGIRLSCSYLSREEMRDGIVRFAAFVRSVCHLS